MVYRQSQCKLAACLVALVACAPGTQPQNLDFHPAPATEESRVVVRNDYFGEVDVYAVAGSTRTRIGSVRTGATANLTIPRSLAMRAEIQFQLDPVGPVRPFTYLPISLTPGNVVELSVMPALQMSSYAIVPNQ
jgi:hypothetical protein